MFRSHFRRSSVVRPRGRLIQSETPAPTAMILRADYRRESPHAVRIAARRSILEKAVARTAAVWLRERSRAKKYTGPAQATGKRNKPAPRVCTQNPVPGSRTSTHLAYFSE